MKVHIIFAPKQGQSRNITREQEDFLKTKKIHYTRVKPVKNYETLAIFQLRHAIIFLDFVQDELPSWDWHILETELMLDGGDPEIFSVKEDGGVLISQERISELRSLMEISKEHQF